MRYVTKNTSKITFSNSHKNVSDRSVDRENVLARNVVTRNGAKLTLNINRNIFFYIKRYDSKIIF